MLLIFLFLIGFGLAIIGSMYIILYLNYLTIGYTFLEYLKLISLRFECWFFIIGLLILTLVIFKKGD